MSQKQYTKKQITQAIAYWEKQLKLMNEASDVKNGMINERYSITDPY